MYVAATRAKRALIVSCAAKSLGGTKQIVSPFVSELLGDLSAETKKALSSDEIEKAWTKLQQFYPLKPNEEEAVRLPFENVEGWLELSVTSLSRYEFCPFEFYLEQVLRLPQAFG